MAILASIEIDDKGSLKIENFRDALTRLGASVEKMGPAQSSAVKPTEAHTNALDGLGAKANLVNAAMSTLVAVGLKNLLEESGRLAARVEVLGTVLAVVGKNANLSTFEMQVQIEKIKKLGITTQEATNSVIQFTQANLKLTDSAKIARVAQDLAVISGQNSSDAFKSLTAAIQVQQPMMLRQFGIVTGLDQIYGAYAKTVGKTVKELDASDKKQAFVNKILEEGVKAAGAYEAAMGDVGKQMTSFARYTEEAKLKLGEALLPAMMLVVTVATDMLKFFNELSPSMQKLATATLVFASALVAVSAAFAGAKFLGIVELFSKIGPAISAAGIALEGGVGLWGAFVALVGGPVTATIIAVTALIAGLAAAYVYFTAENGESTKAMIEQIAATQASVDKVSDLVKSIDMAASAAFRNKTEQDAYNKKIEQLNVLVPGAVGQLNALTGKYELNRDAINAATGALRENLEVQKQAAIASSGKTLQALGAAMDETRKATEKYVMVQKNLADSQKNGASPHYISFLKEQAAAFDETRVAAVKAEAGLRAQKQSEDALINGMDPVREKSKLRVKAMQEGIDALLSLADTDEKATKRIKAAGLGKELEQLYNGVKVITTLDAANKRVKTSVEMSAQEISTLQTQIIEGLTKFEADAKKKLDAAAKSAAKQLADAIKKYSGDNVGMVQDFKALDEVLGKTKNDHEGYLAVLELGAGAIKKYNALTDEQRVKLGLVNLETAASADASRLATLATAKWTEKIGELTLKASEAAREINTKFYAAMADAAQQSSAKQIADQTAFGEEMFEKSRSLYERTVVSKMRAVDQEIFAEHKRIEDLQRGLDKEIKAKQAVVDSERANVREKANLAKQEILDLVNKIDLENRLELTRMKGAPEAKTRELEDERQRQIKAAEIARAALVQGLSDIYDAGVKEIEIREATANAGVDLHQAALEKMKAALGQYVNDEKAASVRVVADIKRSHDVALNAMKNLGLSVVTNVIDGFRDMANGTKSFKDVMLSIFHDIQDAAFKMVEQMVVDWIKGLARKRAAQAAFDASFNANNGAGGVGGAAGGTGSKLGGALMAGTAGFAAGSIIGSHVDGSSAKGFLGGAGAGAGAGAAIGSMVPVLGTAVGAAIGAIAGAIGGWLAARKAMAAMKKDRDELVKGMGGLEAFRLKAEEAGVSVEKLLSTKSPKAYAAEVKKLQEALDKIELKKARTEMVDAAGGMEALRKKAESVGFDLTKAFATESIAVYNSEMEKLNKLFAEQQKRIEGLGVAASGVGLIAQGLTGRIAKGLEGIIQAMGTQEGKALAEGFKKAQDDGFKGDIVAFFLEQAKLYSTAKEGDKGLKTWLSGESLDKYNKLLKDSQAEFTRLGTIAAGTFAQIVAETGDVGAAMAAIGPTLDNMIALQKAFGFEANESFGVLLQFRQTITDNQDVADSLSGVVQVLKGLTTAGVLSQGMFTDLGASALSAYQTMVDRGVAADQIVLMMQPSLQALWEAQQKFGFETDAATQALIDQGVANGTVGEKNRAINQQMLDILKLIAVALGATIPDATDAAARAQERLRNKTNDSTQAYKDQEEAARRAGQAGEDGATGAAEGHSPTGMKQLILRTRESMKAYKLLGQIAVDQSKRIEHAATLASAGLDTHMVMTAARRANNGVDPLSGDTNGRPARGGGSSDSVTQAVNSLVYELSQKRTTTLTMDARVVAKGSAKFTPGVLRQAGI